MIDKMTKLRVNMWIVVVIFSLFGDTFTTIWTIGNSAIVETNPLWRDIYNSGGFAELFILKGVILLVAFVFDSMLVDFLDSWAIPVIPMFFMYSGISVTLANLAVIEMYGDGSIIVAILISIATIAFIEYLRKMHDYEVT